MSVGTADISWQVLRQIVRGWAGSSVELLESRPLHGGQINTTLLLTLSGGERVVLKISPHRVDRRYAEEAQQLAVMRSMELPVPEVYKVFLGSLEQPFSYLLMEFIDGVDLHHAKRHCSEEAYADLQRHLAEMVLSMHGRTGAQYGRVGCHDDRQFARWCDFYRAIYDLILFEAQKVNLLSRKVYKRVARIHDRLDRILEHTDEPRLTHGDLWSTNVLAGVDGAGRWRVRALIDPNCKFAHAESELAYLELFETVTPAFMKAYQCDRKLDPDYHRVRKAVYQLYPLIDHLQMFGAEYADAVTRSVERIAV